MRAKILLVVFLLLLIAGLLVLTPVGKNFFGNMQSLSSLLSFGPNQYFQMQMIANKNNFIGYAFEVSNTTVSTAGLCAGYAQIFGSSHFKDSRCNIIADGAKGKLTFTDVGTIDVDLEASQVTLDNTIIVPLSDKRIKFSVIPTDLYIADYHTFSISLPAIYGEIKRFKLDGSQDQVKTLTGEKVEITKYAGNVRISLNDMVLSGSATKINWFG